MDFSREKCGQVEAEILSLIDQHFKEVGFDGAQEIKPDLVRYRAIEDIGSLRIYTARENRELKGYAIFFVELHHHFDYLRASQDLLYMKPEVRMNAAQFISYCDLELQSDGVKFVSHSVTPKKDFSGLLESLGYRHQETIYTKRLA